MEAKKRKNLGNKYDETFPPSTLFFTKKKIIKRGTVGFIENYKKEF